MITNFKHWKNIKLNESEIKEDQIEKNGYLMFYTMCHL